MKPVLSLRTRLSALSHWGQGLAGVRLSGAEGARERASPVVWGSIPTISSGLGTSGLLSALLHRFC